MTMLATVLRIEPSRIVVRDCSTRQTVIVNICCTCHIRPGDCVRIQYSGMMTMSIPPQIPSAHVRVVCPRMCRRCGHR